MNSMSLFELHGKVALVTGGSRGLGLAIAQGLALAGATVAVTARTTPPESATAKLVFISADLSRAQQRAGLIDRVIRELGSVDILVHAAGQVYRSPAENYPLDRWAEIMELHVTAAFDLAQQAAKHMFARQNGKIILVSSILGCQGGIIVPAYSAAKHAMIGLVRALANEWAVRGINVNALAPGYFDAGV